MNLPVMSRTQPSWRPLESSSTRTTPAFGHAVATCALSESQTPTGEPMMPQAPTQDISRWPCELLEMILQHLDPGDLRRAGQTCRRWYQTACQHRLRLRSFIRTYPLHYRRQLTQTLDADQAPERLKSWYQQLSPATAQRKELEWLASTKLSAHAFFHALTQQLLCATRILCEDSKIRIFCRHFSLHASPDGKALLTQDKPPGAGPAGCLKIWRQSADGLHKAAGYPLDNHLHGLTFSADSRKLLALNQAGQLLTWQQLAPPGWQLSAVQNLCREPVQRAQFSPDARSLAVQFDTSLLMFDETVPNLWRQNGQARWSDNCLPGSVGPETLSFSGDGRHALHVNRRVVVVFDRRDTAWVAQHIDQDRVPSIFKRGELSPSGDWLAIAQGSLHSPSAMAWTSCKSYAIALWCHSDENQSWHFASQSWFVATGMGCPMAFSPDGRHLAAPDRLDNGNVCLALLSLTRNGTLIKSCKLQLGPGIQRPSLLSGIYALNFSSHSRCLAATAAAGMQLWQWLAGSWQTSVWIENKEEYGSGNPSFAFSSDGWHCAVSTGTLGHISIHGPGPGGQYQTKMQITQGDAINHMQFTPDASRLLISCRHRPPLSYNYVSLLHLVPTTGTAACDRAAARAAAPKPDACN